MATRTEYRKWRDSIIAERGKCEQCGRIEEPMEELVQLLDARECMLEVSR